MTNTISRAESGPGLEALLAGIARGEQQKFELFYDQIARKVFGLVKTILRDEAQAEEVSQEILVELWRTAPSYSRAKGTVTTWVMTVAHRRAVDRVRSAAASKRREQYATFEACKNRPYDQVTETVVDADDRQRVRQCLSRLTPLQREAIQLAYYETKTCQEIADGAGISPNTVKSRLRTALHRLRECVEPPIT